MNPRVIRTFLVLVALGALVGALGAIIEPAPEVEITYAYSPDAKSLLEPLIAEFNNAEKVAGGHRVKVTTTEVEGVPSGTAVKEIVKGTRKPVVWTPASSLWGRLLAARYGKALVPESNPSLVTSPQVVAMFKASAFDKGLSSPEQPLSRILELATSGDPKLKLAHTKPDASTSGLSAVLSEFDLVANKRGAELSEEDVLGAEQRKDVELIESSIVHYVDIGKEFVDLWCRYGAPFADAAYIQETTFLEANRVCHGRLIAFYPNDVPMVANYPYMVLDAPWVSSDQREAADVFGQWLQDRLSGDCSSVRGAGFRKDDCVPPGVPRPRGVDLPAPRVIEAVQGAWADLRRPANVMLVIDTTQQMARGGQIELLKRALSSDERSAEPFVGCPSNRDRVGMLLFGREQDPSVETPVSLDGYTIEQRVRLTREISHLAEERGNATLYDAIHAALGTAGMQDPATINTIVLLSFGADDGSSKVSHAELAAELKSLQVQIVAVSYGDRPLAALDELVGESQGRHYNDPTRVNNDPADVASVSRFICQYL
jgi:Ca-activated chloride channel family protein